VQAFVLVIPCANHETASLAKKKKPKKKKDAEEDGPAEGAAAGEEGELDLSSLKKSEFWRRRDSGVMADWDGREKEEE
jgi:hypothetical protein